VPVVHRGTRAPRSARSEADAAARGGFLWTHRCKPGWLVMPASGAVLEAPALVAGLDDVAVVREAIEQRGGHLWIAEDTRPFTKGKIGGDDYRGTLVEAADSVEQQLPASLGEGQIAEFVEDDEVQTGEIIGEPSLASRSPLGLKAVDQIDGGEESAARPCAYTAARDGDRQMRLAGAGRSSVIVPGVWDQKCGSLIRIIHGAATRWRCWAASGTRVQATSLFANLTGRCLCSRVG
jgi:hypothetical protein